MFGEADYDVTRTLPYASFEDQLAALAALVDAGKARRWGVSNETAWGIAKWATCARARGTAGPAVVQNAYNALCRTADTALTEACMQEGVEMQAYSVLAMGLLTGKYTAESARNSTNEGTGKEDMATRASMALQQPHASTEYDHQHHGHDLNAPVASGASRATERQCCGGARTLPVQWQGPRGSRLVRYKHRYAEAESRWASSVYLFFLLLLNNANSVAKHTIG